MPRTSSRPPRTIRQLSKSLNNLSMVAWLAGSGCVVPNGDVVLTGCAIPSSSSQVRCQSADEVHVTSPGRQPGAVSSCASRGSPEVVAGVLRERIVNGELGDGDLLPKQDELIEEYRISRPTLREALRILEGEGLLIVRRGSVGGLGGADADLRYARPTRSGCCSSHAGQRSRTWPRRSRHIEPITASLCAGRPDRDRASSRPAGQPGRYRGGDLGRPAVHRAGASVP